MTFFLAVYLRSELGPVLRAFCLECAARQMTTWMRSGILRRPNASNSWTSEQRLSLKSMMYIVTVMGMLPSHTIRISGDCSVSCPGFHPQPAWFQHRLPEWKKVCKFAPNRPTSSKTGDFHVRDLPEYLPNACQKLFKQMMQHFQTFQTTTEVARIVSELGNPHKQRKPNSFPG